MEERFINKKRSLVGVNMGDGCECPSEPREAVDYLVRNCDDLARRLGNCTNGMIYSIRSGVGVDNYGTRGYLSRAINKSKIIKLAEQFETAQLEVAWMFGRQSVVDKLNEGRAVDLTDRFIKREQNG